MKSSFVALRSASLLSAAPCLVAALLGVAEATPRFEQVEQVERSPTSIAACEIAVEADAGSETGQIDVSESFHVFDAQLEKLITALLTGNPRLQSARARCASSRERVAQHRSLPDPQLQYRYFASPPETRVGPQRHGLEISQAFPWAGKRSLQAERSSHQAESLAWEVRALERSLVAELKRVYFDAAYLQEALRVNHAEKELLRRFEQIALTRYKTGQGIQQNVVKVQTDINRLIDREAFLREQLLVIERQIARLIGSSGGPISLDPIRLAPPPALEDTSQLASRSLSKHPSARSRETRIAADSAWVRRRQLEARPDFRVGLSYTAVGDREDPAGVLTPPADNGQDILALAVGINIPLFRKRIASGVAEAQAHRRSSQRDLDDVLEELRFLLRRSLVRLDSLGERTSLYTDTLIPQAGESLASAEAAYTTNRLGILDLLDAERVLFQLRLTHQRLVADSWIALADVEFAFGEPFPRGGPTR